MKIPDFLRVLLFVSAAACSTGGARIVADVPTTSRVTVGTAVRFRGTDIGRVTHVVPLRTGVRLELALDRADAPVRVDDRVAIRPDGIFGGVVIEIVPGSDTALPVSRYATLSAAPSNPTDSVQAAVMRAAGEALLARLQDDLRRPRESRSRP